MVGEEVAFSFLRTYSNCKAEMKAKNMERPQVSTVYSANELTDELLRNARPLQSQQQPKGVGGGKIFATPHAKHSTREKYKLWSFT